MLFGPIRLMQVRAQPAGSHFVGMRELADGFETSWPTLKTAMERIRSLLLDRGALLCNVTTDAASWRRFEPELASFLNTLPSTRSVRARIGGNPHPAARSEHDWKVAAYLMPARKCSVFRDTKARIRTESLRTQVCVAGKRNF